MKRSNAKRGNNKKVLISVDKLVGGMILLVLGMIGEYMGRVYICINDSPQYIVRNVTGERDIKE